jgi:hypothetical protein
VLGGRPARAGLGGAGGGRAGARAAAIQADPGAVNDAVVGSVHGLDPSGLTVSIARSGAQGDPVTVTVGYVSVVRVPLVSWLFGGSVSMKSDATDRQEFSS